MGELADLAGDVAIRAEALESDHAKTVERVAELEADIIRLTEELALRPPLTATPTIVGSSAQPGNVDAYDTLESEVGPLGAWRIFIAGSTPGPYDVERIRTCFAKGRRAVVSVTAGTSVTSATAAAKTFVAAVKSLDGTGSITFGHEPTQKFADPKAYIAAKNAYYRVIKADLPGWDCIDIFMLYDITQGGARHPDFWIADLNLLDGFGVDAYDNRGRLSPEELLAPALALADLYCLPLWVTETSTIEDPDRPDYKAQWIADFCAYASSVERIPGWLWFHSKVGANAPSYGWFVNTSEASTAAFRDAVATCPPY